MTLANAQPLTLSALRAECLRDMLNSAVVCSAVAALFWAIGFGTGASPSVPHLLVTVTLPAFVFGDYIRYRLGMRKIDFASHLPTQLAGVGGE